jgi:multicomponent Na+:H+ antiporter subunit E
MTERIVWLITLIKFVGFYSVEVIVSNFRVARDVLSPRLEISPGIVAVPLGDLTDRQIWFLATLLTMTPGTLSLEVDEVARKLYLHCLYTQPSPAELRETIKVKYVRPLCILI